MKGKTYRIGDALGSVLEIYFLDGLSDGLDVFEDDAPAFARVHEFVKSGWRKPKGLFVPDDGEIIRDLLTAASWAGDSIYDDTRTEERLPLAPRPKKLKDELDREMPTWNSLPAPRTRDVEVLRVCKAQTRALDDFTARLIRQLSALTRATEAT